jgi:hypothetical protein
MSTSIPTHTLLRILEVRDQQTRQDLVDDIRLLLAENFCTLDSTGSVAPVTYTEDKIIEIVTPLLMRKSVSGKYSSSYILFINHSFRTDTDQSANTEDIDMAAPPAPPVTAREIAAALFAEMQKNGKYFSYK